MNKLKIWPCGAWGVIIIIGNRSQLATILLLLWSSGEESKHLIWRSEDQMANLKKKNHPISVHCVNLSREGWVESRMKVKGYNMHVTYGL